MASLANILADAGNGVRTVMVEDASRFARDLVVQELGVLLLIKRDVPGFASALSEGHPRLALMANGPLTRRACNQYGTGGQRPSRPWSSRPRPPVTKSRSQRGEADRGAPGAGCARPVTHAARDSHFPNCALHHAAGRVRHHVGPPRRSAPTRWLRSRYECVCAGWHAHAVFASVGGLCALGDGCGRPGKGSTTPQHQRLLEPVCPERTLPLRDRQ